jgi:hypothetical protein
MHDQDACKFREPTCTPAVEGVNFDDDCPARTRLHPNALVRLMVLSVAGV